MLLLTVFWIELTIAFTCVFEVPSQINAIVNSIQKTVSKSIQEKAWHIEGTDNAEWILMDYVHVVVHVFQKHIREFYDIEGLWGDAKTVKIETTY